MDSTFSAILMVLVMFGAGLFIIEPFLRKNSAGLFEDDYQETPLHHLLSRKDSIYTAMKDLEFDYTTGKLSDDDYEALRSKFAVQAAGVLEEIDDMTGKGGGRAKKPKAAADDSVAKGRFCSACGHSHGEGDKFCEGCGAALS